MKPADQDCPGRRWMVVGIADVRSPYRQWGVSIHYDREYAESLADRLQVENNRENYMYIVIPFLGMHVKPEEVTD